MTTPFDQLPIRTQYARLRPLAQHFASQFGLKPKSLKLIHYGYNATYKLETQNNQLLALKLILESPRTLPNLAAEVNWCHTLAAKGIPVVSPVSRNIYSANLEGFPKPIYAMCAHWLPGTLFPTQPTNAQLQKVSQLTKALHENPPNLEVNESFPEFTETLAGTPCKLSDPLLLDTIAECNAVIKKAWQQQPATSVHFDLHSWNMRYHQGIAYAFDFEFAQSAPPLLDIAALIFSHRFSRRAPDTDTPLWSAFPYRPSDFDVTDREFELVMIGRKILLANDLFNLTNPLLTATRDRNLARTTLLVEHFHRTGKYDPSILP